MTTFIRECCTASFPSDGVDFGLNGSFCCASGGASTPWSVDTQLNATEHMHKKWKLKASHFGLMQTKIHFLYITPILLTLLLHVYVVALV